MLYSRKRKQSLKASEILNEIRTQVGEENLTKSCSGVGFLVYMTGVPPERVVVDVDCLFDARGMKGKTVRSASLFHRC